MAPFESYVVMPGSFVGQPSKRPPAPRPRTDGTMLVLDLLPNGESYFCVYIYTYTYTYTDAAMLYLSVYIYIYVYVYVYIYM